MAAVCLGLGMLMVDTFVVNVALPAIGRDLNANLSSTEWVVTGYILVIGVFPVAMGRLGDIFGRKRMYLAGLVIFVGASVACGLAQDIGQLIAFRVLKGFGAAIMMPLTLSIITNAFPASQRGLAIGIWGGVSGVGLLAGPILGGLLANSGDWRLVFLVNLPIGIIGVVAALLFVTESRDETAPRRIDFAGLVTLSLMLFLFIFGVNQGNHEGWTSPLILGCFVGAAVLLPTFILLESRVKAPLVDLTLFRSGSFVGACVSAGLFSAAVFGSQPFTSLFMQNYWGLSPLQGGLAFIPATLLVALLMPVSGILAQKLGSKMRLLIIAGSLSVLISFIYLLFLDLDSGYADGMLPAFLLRGLGIGLVMSAASYAAVSAVPLAKSGLASGTLTMSRQVGTSIGIAVFGAVFVRSIDRDLESTVAGLPPAEAATVIESADRFTPIGTGALGFAVDRAILDGFIEVAAWGIALSAIALAAAFTIRMKAPKPATASPTVAANSPIVAPAPGGSGTSGGR